jgi:hypothetical protein
VMWDIELQGGAYGGTEFEYDGELQPVLIVWACDAECGGHATFNPENPNIVLKTAESYRRGDVDLDERRAIYVVGEADPELEVEYRELVGTSSDLGNGWPVSR